MTISLRKLLTFCDATACFPPKCHFPDLVSVTSQCVISMECLRSFLRHHFMGKPVVALWNVSSFLRLHFYFLCFIFIILSHLLFTEPREEWFETHSSSNFNEWFFVVVYISRQLNQLTSLFFFSGLLKMLSFGFQKLKIFLLLKTLERFVTDCHLNPLMFKQFFSHVKKVILELTFQSSCTLLNPLSC